MANIQHILPRLRSQFERGEPVLFTGAGFSIKAHSSTGELLPTSSELTREFWQLAFPDMAIEEGTRLGDAYYAALQRNRSSLAGLIAKRFSVDSESLPDFYRRWFSMPWSRCYTLNIDDVEIAASMRYGLGQSIQTVSATSGRIESRDIGVNRIQVIHLNGLVGDQLSQLVFSSVDYGIRQTSPDMYLSKAVNDIIARPVIFVGTQLDEPTLWQYLEYRNTKGPRGTRELRPGSILVSPNLNRARELLLRELNIDWVKMDAEEFAEQVLEKLESTIEIGRSALRIKKESAQQTPYPPLISDISAREITKPTDYLLGQEPQWTDLLSGRAIERSCDPEILKAAQEILNGQVNGKPLVITGTAGSGKSTSLMRLGLQLAAQGITAYWADEKSNFEVHRLRNLVVEGHEPIAILVDDADIFGRWATGWARDLPSLRPGVLFAAATRSTKVDGLLDGESLGGIEPTEISMPLLEDSDIDELIRVLDAENRLGILKGASVEKRRTAFRNQAGRQLLVGMFQATSGLRFAEKTVQEFESLASVSRFIYGLVCLVNSQRYTLTLEEVLTAVGVRDNATLNAINRLVSRGLLTRTDHYSGYGARHRMIAEQVVNSQIFRSGCRDIIEGLFVALASSITPADQRTSRAWRRFIRFINHEFLLNFLSPEDSRRIYGTIEAMMSWDYHFWLQRGSLEVQEGDLELATNYLGQARSLSPIDRLVQAEWSYLLMKKAARRPRHTDAKSWFSEGYETIIAMVEDNGTLDPHPYHILGSQTIAWVRSANLTTHEARILLGKASEIVKQGSDKNPKNNNLKQLSRDLTRELLMTTVAK